MRNYAQYVLSKFGARTGCAQCERGRDSCPYSSSSPSLGSSEGRHTHPHMGTRVDGVVSAELGLHGKPEPDIFTTACDRVKADYAKSIVVEDAVSGVQAGIKGKFGLTIGIARENNVKELSEAGAHIVVEDLEEIGGIEGLNKIFAKFNQ